MPGGWVYILTNRPHGTLHVGVTADLARRVWEHRIGAGSRFAARCRLGRLVHAERHESILGAVQREKNIKHWSRAWKIAPNERGNPHWSDLYDALLR